MTSLLTAIFIILIVLGLYNQFQYRKMSVETVPTDDPQAKDSANDHLQNDQPPYVDEDTYPLIALPTALPPSQQPDQYYPVPSRKLVPCILCTCH